ncbi:D-Ala-D-Ala carboxypeptidase family metallohydrolase [Butyricimonas faecalis]|uniref:D-Ala-D-Ala carboxypeptidase family metallohydrolase n=1 Tax=Butyricimonas faecalis TaxID=2093856 RepID=UPI000D0BE51E|nr:D-Ala-D-Ala carboxypeptidase family metallohydrolase [Butyricimonas faecalis]
MNNEKLSENFDLEEFTRSDKAKELGITNEPGEKELAALRELVSRTIQPLRDKLGVPIHVNSGYRCPELNKAVGGVPTSQHQKGEAADLSIDGKASDILEALENNNIPFDQAILYRKQNFLHVSLKLDGVQRSNVIIKT